MNEETVSISPFVEEFSPHALFYNNSFTMALVRGFASTIPTMGHHIARASPVLLRNVYPSFQDHRTGMPMVQKRTYILPVVLHWAFGSTPVHFTNV